MYRFDKERINNIPISQVASRFATVKTKGRQKVTLCPWHDDNSPSLVLYESGNQNHCHCFACGHHDSVINYTMASNNWDFTTACEWLSNEFGIPETNTQKSLPRPKIRKIEHKQKPTYAYIPNEYMQSTLSTQSSFCQCLYKIFPAYCVNNVINEYCLGMTEDKELNADVIFWSIDYKGRVCDGKVQRYCTDIDSPEFMHCDKKVIYWLGKRLPTDVIPPTATLNHNCLFGEHLLSQHPQATVMLVESPKNAIIGACNHPKYIWLATGNKSNLTRETMSVLAHRNVIVYPDRDAITEWSEKLSKMRDIANFAISKLCEDEAPTDSAKYDIADHIISHLTNH